MNTTIILVVVASAIFFGLVFAAVNLFGTRLTGQQIAEDPDARSHVDPDLRDDDFPVSADY